ncbi:glutamate--tRNA ligase [Candidatus Nucleicultrix amoebiphila]|uniref:Glutamate--tRNA ligase n=1 Tax=Candidatus Nucleicultrix amoebiphila FS5 TaxID=1414854 RepID=A0A1W6N2U0_9PROT|nr:glutamate--tRNA ligase [Candidatus Nucleicultrix amoebiphila]ARN84096.1 glutamyl-tRNA synthetase [Candidatus Nucleicultrix amoebiphila FS5]
MSVVTRFAPSPTGFLHIGSARTALFNWLYARNQGGKFLLRIEDTDRARSTQEAINVIIKGLKWLNLDWDDEVIFQFARANRHQAIAHQLLAEGKAYYCYCTPEELTEMREKAKAEGRPPRYDGRWRNRDPKEAPAGILPALRLKAPSTRETILDDLVQGRVVVQNEQLDDMVLLRGDGTPTYMLSVVVDDHDMAITHVIRGDDHLTNTFRQKQIYQAMGWDEPSFSHIPLIHGPDGAKLSKRHGALGVDAYEAMGFLPEAMTNYLLRLGWSHGDDEIISMQQAIEWFNIASIGKSPARFDMAKLTSVNAHYMRLRPNTDLIELIRPLLVDKRQKPLSPEDESVLTRGMEGLKQRARTLEDLADSALIYVSGERPIPLDEKARNLLNEEAVTVLKPVIDVLAHLSDWQEASLEAALRAHSDVQGLKFGVIAQPLRAALTGRGVSPGIFEVMVALGKEESIQRLKDIADA